MKKILIANRGEIAVRIIRACQELGLKTVAICSTADKDSLHVKIADESVCIGPAKALDSYLSIPKIISACEISGADAVHPGYGFLSESARFAEICERCGLVFIGPGSSQIKLLGDKIQARTAAEQARVPLLPGSSSSISTVKEGLSIASDIGYPVIIKASAGGGGRGMKIVNDPSSFEPLFYIAQQEAQKFFGNSTVYIEKYCLNPKHVEVQILSDGTNCLQLGERDCSIQRKNQKLIEESPCPIFTDKLREKIGSYALLLAKKIGYKSLGTVEFLMDEDSNLYFMEVNTRVQVEHPVTEAVTGIDIIKEQIKIALGDSLSIKQSDIRIQGHAIECRINAEDPDNFAPCPGSVKYYHEPGGPGIRIDSFLYQGYTIPTYYDSLIAKIIAHAPSRTECISRMLRALKEFKIEGIKTNIPLHQRILQTQEFISGKASIRFLDNR